MHFTTLSIKTANEKPASLCALEITIVNNGCITGQKNWFFRPYEMRFEPVQKYLYNIRPIDIIDASDFYSQWEEIKPYLDGKLLICHQAAYVVNTLCRLLDELNLPYPNSHLADTMLLCRCAYPQLPSRKLRDVCVYLGLTMDIHSKAGYSNACAQIMLKLARIYHFTTCEELLEQMHCSFGRIGNGTITLPSWDIQLERSLQAESDSTSSENRSHHLQLAGQVICLTGPLESMTRSQAVKQLNRLGAIYSSSVTHKTSIVITNVKNPESQPREHLTSKLRRALILKDEGHIIHIINEETFLSLIQ